MTALVGLLRCGDVCLGSIASILRCLRYVRSCPKSGDKADMPGLRIRATSRHSGPLTRRRAANECWQFSLPKPKGRPGITRAR